MDELIKYFKDYLARNQFASGGLFIFILTSIWGFFYKVVPHISRFLKRKFIVTIDMQSNDDVFRWLMVWLASQKYANRTKKLTVSSRSDELKNHTLYFSPGPGNHFFFYRGRLVWLNRNRERSTDSGMFIFHEEFTITMMGRDVRLAKEMISEAAEFAKQYDSDRLVVYSNKYDYWSRMQSQSKRNINSVILAENKQSEILEDVKGFFGNKQLYEMRGIPYRRGYLFFGNAGTGKTSLVKAIASELSLPLYIFNLQSSNDGHLMSLVGEIPFRSAILIEDIDTAFKKRKKDDDKIAVSFNGFINMIDGAVSPEGTVLFMTTNHIKRLDDALIRPGRIDIRHYFGKVGKERIFSETFIPIVMVRRSNSVN